MPITNKLNLPAPIVEALKRETYDPGDGDFSATELISPPKIKALQKRHKEEIFEDASDMLYSLYGQTVHLILERAGVKLGGSHSVETRYYAQYGKWRVSAQVDCLYLEGGILTDYKFTTSYSAQKNTDGTMDTKKEWYAQLNIQADILRRNGIGPINALEICALLRDWQPTKAAQDPLYPQSQIVLLPIPMAAPAKVEQYILNRCELHERARNTPDDLIPECSSEERWEDPTKFSAMKQGNKKATKNFESYDEAAAWIANQRDAAAFSILEKPSFPRRCLGVAGKIYCQASKFCHYHKMLVEQYKTQSQEAQP